MAQFITRIEHVRSGIIIFTRFFAIPAVAEHFFDSLRPRQRIFDHTVEYTTEDKRETAWSLLEKFMTDSQGVTMKKELSGTESGIMERITVGTKENETVKSDEAENKRI